MLKIDLKAFACSCGVLWGAAVLAVALANLVSGAYGQAFLEVLASWYPGYHAAHSLGAVALVTVYAFFDGLIGGWIFGWLYNKLLKPAPVVAPRVEHLQEAGHVS